MENTPDFDRSFPKDIEDQIRINDQDAIPFCFKMFVTRDNADFGMVCQEADFGLNFIEIGNGSIRAVGGNIGADLKEILSGDGEKTYLVFSSGQDSF